MSEVFIGNLNLTPFLSGFIWRSKFDFGEIPLSIEEELYFLLNVEKHGVYFFDGTTPLLIARVSYDYYADRGRGFIILRGYGVEAAHEIVLAKNSPWYLPNNRRSLLMREIVIWEGKL